MLDEVDAPRDDANAERFCNLFNSMRQRINIRFMVITQHPLAFEGRVDEWMEIPIHRLRALEVFGKLYLNHLGGRPKYSIALYASIRCI